MIRREKFAIKQGSLLVILRKRLQNEPELIECEQMGDMEEAYA